MDFLDGKLVGYFAGILCYVSSMTNKSSQSLTPFNVCPPHPVSSIIHALIIFVRIIAWNLRSETVRGPFHLLLLLAMYLQGSWWELSELEQV